MYKLLYRKKIPEFFSYKESLKIAKNPSIPSPLLVSP